MNLIKNKETSVVSFGSLKILKQFFEIENKKYIEWNLLPKLTFQIISFYDFVFYFLLP